MIPASLRAQMPMLAVPVDIPIERALLSGDTVFDVKHDGTRALLYIDDGVVTIRNKQGVDVTVSYPDIVEHARQAHPAGQLVLDGEILVFNTSTNRFDFALALRRNGVTARRAPAAARAHPATYMAFDVLYVDGTDHRSASLTHRLGVLADLAIAPLQKSPSSTDGATMWGLVEQYGFEGLMAKTVRSPYRPGRGHDWVKLKRKHRVTAIVTGWEPGEGGRTNQIGALFLALLRDGVEIPIGKVGTGFKRADHAPILSVLEAGHQFLAEIEYLEVTREGILRQPSFKGVRHDTTREECTMEQLA